MKRFGVIAMALAMGVLGGCSHGEKAEVSRQAQGLNARLEHAVQQAKQGVGNASLAAKVKSALDTRKELHGADVHVDARGAAVTLTGYVNTRAQAAVAEKVARDTEGVQNVGDHLMLRVPVKSASAAVAGR